jgi:hypothetical protein
MISALFRSLGVSPAGVTARLSVAVLAAAFSCAAQEPAQPTPPPAQADQPAQPAAASADSQAVQAPATAAQPAPQPAQPSTSPDASQQPASSAPQAQAAPAASNAQATVQAPAAAPPDQPTQTQPAAPADQAAAPSQPSTEAESSKPSQESSQAGAITEEELRRLLVGKSLYLRGGYLDNNLSFGENGQLIGHSPQGSYTLSGIEIDKVHLSKHKVELDGARYGLHFLGALPYEDPTKAVDRVKITPKKKFVRITIDRELVVTPKKKKEKDQGKNAKSESVKSVIGPGGLVMPAESETQAEPAPASSTADNSSNSADNAKPAGAPAQATAQQTASAPESSDEDQAKAEMATAPKEERPADPNSVTTTTSPAHAAQVLRDALGKIFAPGLDDKMMASMPDFWKLYYEAVAAKTDYRPKDPSVLRQSAVDEKAKLLSKFEPESNDFAQDSGVAGMCLYHTVIGADGKPGEIAVARPIGFGLDENAVAAIRKASFQPAMKDGKPVAVMLDLVVQFRIYSKRTNVASKPEDANKPQEAILPGPYTLQDLMLRRTQAQTQ